jgi:hypothetical protein
MKDKSGLGEFWDNWLEESENEKSEINRAVAQKKDEATEREEAYLTMRKQELEQMQARYNFPLTAEIIPALERLEKLAVNKYRNDDYSWQDSFDKIWYSVLHEVDLYEEGEESPLNKTTVKGAKNWLKSFAHLYTEKVPSEYKPE